MGERWFTPYHNTYVVSVRRFFSSYTMKTLHFRIPALTRQPAIHSFTPYESKKIMKRNSVTRIGVDISSLIRLYCVGEEPYYGRERICFQRMDDGYARKGYFKTEQ